MFYYIDRYGYTRGPFKTKHNMKQKIVKEFSQQRNEKRTIQVLKQDGKIKVESRIRPPVVTYKEIK